MPSLLLPRAACAEEQIDFHIARDDLAKVVLQIGSAAHRSIIFSPKAMVGLQSSPVVGRLTIRQALDAALAGTGLHAVSGASGTLSISGTAHAGAKGGAEDLDIADIDVTGAAGADRGFAAVSTTSSSRIEGDIQKTPESIASVTKDVLVAQGTTSIAQSVTNTSNIVVTPSTGSSSAPNYTVRGFPAGVVVDGYPGGSSSIPIEDIDRVDVLKGPNGTLTGNVQPGGLVNVVTKQPTDEVIRSAKIYLGSYFYKTLAFDFGGPVAGVQGVTYRFNISGNNASESYAGYKNPHEYLISPSVRWTGDSTTVTAGVRYIDQKVGPVPFTQIPPGSVGASPLKVPFRPLGSDRAYGAFQSVQPYIEVLHNLGALDMGYFGAADFSVRNRTSYLYSKFSTQLFNAQFPFGNTITALAPDANRGDGGFLQTATDLLVNHRTQFVEQTLRFGIDYKHVTNSNVDTSNGPPGGTLQFVNLLNPISGLSLPPFVRGTPSRATTDNVGETFQDKIDVVDRLHILGSVRADQYDALNDTFNGSSKRHSIGKTSYTPISYSAGAAFDVLPWLSVYGQDGHNFLARTGTLYNGTQAPPVFVDNDEVGVKASFLDKRLNVTMAFYDLGETNVIAYNPALGGNGDYVIPGFHSTGVEVEVQGQVTPNLSVIGSFAHSRFKNLVPGDETLVPDEPATTASLFGYYTFLDGMLKGFSFGGGAHGLSSSYVDYATSKATANHIPGYVVADLALGYKRDNVEVNFNLNNVFDKYYMNPSANSVYISVNEGRNFVLTTKILF